MIYDSNQPSLWLRQDPLILASRSEARLALLRAAQIPVQAYPSDLDEREIEASAKTNVVQPSDIARSLAQAKALAVARSFPRRLVLGADQILALDGRILHKPVDRSDLARRLHDLSARTHTLHSAIALVFDGSVLFETCGQAALTCRPLGDEFIERYLALAGANSLASVGGYEIEGLGIHLFERIEGRHSTILGLPMLELLAYLRQNGHLAE